MTTKKVSSWMRMRRNNTTGRVGQFYNHFAGSLLHGEIPLGWAEHGSDVVNNDLCFEVEVKGSSNEDHFRIAIAQKERHLRKVPFPVDTFLYCLFSYRAKWKKVVVKVQGKEKTFWRSKLGSRRTKAEQFADLANWTDESFLLDIEVVNAFEQTLGTKVGKFAGDKSNEETVVLERQRHLRPIWNGGRDELLSTLGLSAKDWRFGRYPLRRSFMLDGHQYEVDFYLCTMLRPRFHRKLLKAYGFSNESNSNGDAS